MIEFPSTDAAASAEFFKSAFGLDHLAYGVQYADVQIGDGQTLGFQGDLTEAPSGPLTVFEVDDLEQARADIESAGGTVTCEPFLFPGGRRFHFREPGGNELAVWVRD